MNDDTYYAAVHAELDAAEKREDMFIAMRAKHEAELRAAWERDQRRWYEDEQARLREEMIDDAYQAARE